jgi:predicted PurR-regulated permease PerM
MDSLNVLLIVVISVLTVLLVIVGIQVIFILKEIRQTLRRVNQTLDSVDHVVQGIKNPFAEFGGVIKGIKSGLKVVETFGDWMRRKTKEDDEAALEE